MDIIYISNFKVKANVKIESELFRCDFVLDKDLKISSLGIEDDIPLSPGDIAIKDLNDYQKEIDIFIEAQSHLVMKSDHFGCYYRLNKTVLEYAAMLSNGSCDTEWAEVEFPASSVELGRINEFFKSNFTANEFAYVHELE